MKKENWLILTGILTIFLPTLLLILMVNLLFFVPLAAGIITLTFGIIAHVRKINLKFLNVLLIFCLFSAFGPILYTVYIVNRPAKKVHFIFPNHYVGPVVIIKAKEYPINWKKEKGRYVMLINKEGVFYTSDDSPITNWHRLSAEYENGEKIDTESNPNIESKMHLKEGGASIRDGCKKVFFWFFLGMKQKENLFLEDRDQQNSLIQKFCQS